MVSQVPAVGVRIAIYRISRSVGESLLAFVAIGLVAGCGSKPAVDSSEPKADIILKGRVTSGPGVEQLLGEWRDKKGGPSRMTLAANGTFQAVDETLDKVKISLSGVYTYAGDTLVRTVRQFGVQGGSPKARAKLKNDARGALYKAFPATVTWISTDEFVLKPAGGSAYTLVRVRARQADPGPGK
jgi:hypothetical protein